MSLNNRLKEFRSTLEGAFKRVRPVEELRALRVSDVESKLPEQLPPDYRSFLVNGGEPEPFLNTFDVYADLDHEAILYSFTVRKYLTINPGKKDDLLYNYRKFEELTPIPNLLPIAFDQFRNIMAISLDDHRVYFWDYLAKVDDTLESHADDSIIRGDKLYLVAPNFERFYSRLYRKNTFK